MKKKAAPASPRPNHADHQKLAAEIAAAQKQADAAKKAAQAAKAESKLARKKYKEARRSAKKLRKAVEALKAEFETASRKKARALPRRRTRAVQTAPASKPLEALPVENPPSATVEVSPPPA